MRQVFLTKKNQGIAAGLAMAAALISPSTQASNPIKPQWSEAKTCEQSPNSSFLNDVNAGLTNEQKAMDRLIDQGTAIQLRQQYEDLVRDYDRRDLYGQVGL